MSRRLVIICALSCCAQACLSLSPVTGNIKHPRRTLSLVAEMPGHLSDEDDFEPTQEVGCEVAHVYPVRRTRGDGRATR